MSEPKNQPQSGKKKKKGKTVALHQFLADPNVGGGTVVPEPAKRTTSWADASDDIDTGDVSTAWDDQRVDKRAFDLSKLPTAPRSVRETDIDLSRLPKQPPYTLFLGNLSYEVDEDSLKKFFESRNVQVECIRLPTDTGTSRLKGFGYAEFKDVDNLLAAVQLNSEMVNNRPIRIDLANSSDQDGGPRRGGHFEDRSDWRRADDDDEWRRNDSPRRGGYDDRRYDRGGRGGGGYGRSRDYDSPPHGPGGRDRYDRYGDRFEGREQYGGRERRYDDRHGDRYGDDRWQHDRFEDHGARRGGRGYSPPRGGRGYSPPRGGRGYSPPRGGRRYEYDRGGRDYPPRDGYGREERDRPKERRKLQLQPRSKPTEPEETQASSSIFGGAKPVDTLSKELEVEERLRQKEEEQRKRLEEERARREEEERVRRAEGDRHADERAEQGARREKERHPSRSDDTDWRKSDEGTGSRRRSSDSSDKDGHSSGRRRDDGKPGWKREDRRDYPRDDGRDDQRDRDDRSDRRRDDRSDRRKDDRSDRRRDDRSDRQRDDRDDRRRDGRRRDDRDDRGDRRRDDRDDRGDRRRDDRDDRGDRRRDDRDDRGDRRRDDRDDRGDRRRDDRDDRGDRRRDDRDDRSERRRDDRDDRRSDDRPRWKEDRHRDDESDRSRDDQERNSQEKEVPGAERGRKERQDTKGKPVTHKLDDQKSPSFSQPSRYASLRDDSDSGEERDEEERPAALEGEEN